MTAPAAYAGHWVLSASGSSATASYNGQPFSTPWQAPADTSGVTITLPGYSDGGGRTFPVSAQANMTVSVTGTWTKDSSSDTSQPPTTMAVVEQSTAGSSYNQNGGTLSPGTMDDGIGQSSPNDGPTNVIGDKVLPVSGGSFTADNTMHPDGDAPGVPVDDSFTKYRAQENFSTYLMYEPPGSDVQWVPLNLIGWNWNADVSIPGSSWSTWPSATLAGTLSVPVNQRQLQQPTWTQLMLAAGWP